MPTLVTDEDHLHALRHRRGVKVKALSKKGRHTEAEEALNRMTDLADRGVRGDAQGFWTPSELYFSPSWVYAAMGRGDATARAREELLRRTPAYVYATNIRLHEAWAAIDRGGVERGASQAVTTMAAVPDRFRPARSWPERRAGTTWEVIDGLTSQVGGLRHEREEHP